LPDYDVLSFEPVASDSTSSVAVDTDFATTIRLRSGFGRAKGYVGAGRTGVLLRNGRNWLHHTFPRDRSHSSTHTISNTPADSAANPAAHTPTNTATYTAASACRSSRPLQLRSGHTGHVESRQEVVVLHAPPRRMPSNRSANADAGADAGAHRASTACRPIQLCGWLRQLGGGMVCGQEGVVLQGAWQRMPRAGSPSAGSRLRACRTRRCSLRLQCRICQLDGGMECTQEGLVLQECWQGLPTSSWRLRLKALGGQVSGALEGSLALTPSSGDTLNMLLLAAKFVLKRANI